MCAQTFAPSEDGKKYSVASYDHSYLDQDTKIKNPDEVKNPDKIKNEITINGDNIAAISFKRLGSLSVSRDERRLSFANTFFGQVGDRRFSQDLRRFQRKFIRETSNESDVTISSSDSDQDNETAKVIFFQVFIPFLIAGFGNVGAGLILDEVQHWPVFKLNSQLFLLIAAFLGFKGNLEMTLAARLATQANTGKFIGSQIKIAIGNVALIQCQSIVVGFLAAMIAIISELLKNVTSSSNSFNLESSFLITSTALVTSSVTGLILTILMVIVTSLSLKFNVNPDNVSTLIAAFLGDMSAAMLLSYSAKLFYDLRYLIWLGPAVCSFFIIIILPISFLIAHKNEFTHQVIGTGWYPILIAMVISSIGGYLFELSVGRFQSIAVFQTIVNGVGSNLVAVQASRVSTYFHQRFKFGYLSSNHLISWNPLKAFFGSHTNVRTARLLILMSLPGHVIYLITIRLIQGGDKIIITIPFVSLYLIATLVQVILLMYISHMVVPYLWSKSIDPDNAAIPGLMSMGDLLGTALIMGVFFLLQLLSDPNVLNHDDIIIQS